MNETYAEQRDRIIGNSDIRANEFDMFVALGYEPESWYGMWKLPVRPIIFRGFGIVIFREVIYKPGGHEAIYRGFTAKTRLRLRLDPLR